MLIYGGMFPCWKLSIYIHSRFLHVFYMTGVSEDKKHIILMRLYVFIGLYLLVFFKPFVLI